MLYAAINLITWVHDVSGDQQPYNAQYRWFFVLHPHTVLPDANLNYKLRTVCLIIGTVCRRFFALAMRL